jgi:hypothetical protein
MTNGDTDNVQTKRAETKDSVVSVSGVSAAGISDTGVQRIAGRQGIFDRVQAFANQAIQKSRKLLSKILQRFR